MGLMPKHDEIKIDEYFDDGTTRGTHFDKIINTIHPQVLNKQFLSYLTFSMSMYILHTKVEPVDDKTYRYGLEIIKKVAPEYADVYLASVKMYNKIEERNFTDDDVVQYIRDMGSCDSDNIKDPVVRRITSKMSDMAYNPSALAMALMMFR